MAQTLSQRLQNLGVPQGMGQEVERQINAGSGSAPHLQFAGFVLQDAVTLAHGINIGSVDPVALSGGSVIPEVAVEIASTINQVPILNQANPPTITIDTTLDVGQMVEANIVIDNWYSKSPYDVSFQWCINGVPVPGETDDRYTIMPADVGKFITYIAVATNANGASAPYETEEVGPVLPE